MFKDTRTGKFNKGITAFSITLVLFVSLFAVATYIIPAFADVDVQVGPALHNATVTIGIIGVTPNATLSTICGATNQFFVNVEHTGGDPIEEVRLYNGMYLGRHTEIPPHTNYVCGAVPNSSWAIFDLHPSIPACQYNIIQGNSPLNSGETATFTFDATLTTESNYKWVIETRDSNQQWRPWNLSLRVDCTPPITTKSFLGPNSINEYGVEWIDGITSINLSAVDEVVHDTGIAAIYYELSGPIDNDYCESSQACDAYSTENHFSAWDNMPIGGIGESCHIIQYYSRDGVGNNETPKNNCFYVDKTPPVLTKTVGTPKLETNLDEEELGNGNVAWTFTDALSGSSAKLSIGSSATDFAGVDSFFNVFVELDDVTSISYQRKALSFTNGWSPLVILGIDANGDGVYDAQPLEWQASWNGVSFNPVLLGSDSFIACESVTGLVSPDAVWTSVDAYGTFNCYTPNVAGDGYVAYNPLSYFQANNVGRIETTDNIAMLKVELGGNLATQQDEVALVDNVEFNGNLVITEPGYTIVGKNTPITFTCADQQPHPSGDEQVCFDVDVDGIDNTTAYCSSYGGTLSSGYCCHPVDGSNQFVFNFLEDSDHALTYYCKDAVDKKSSTDIQIYKVDTVPPVITKTVIGAQQGVCPPAPNSNDVCYIDLSTVIHVDVQDTGGLHDIGVDRCTWSYTVNEDPTGGPVVETQFPFNIIFPQESFHNLTITCTDVLGNSVSEWEYFNVDSTPPVTTKTYGEPFFSDSTSEWITSQTPVILSAADNKVGVATTYWRNTLLGSDLPCEDINVCEAQEGSGDWNVYLAPFYKPETSCHLIEYQSIDLLGNTEPVKKQCAFIDNEAPVSNKIIGTPKVVVSDVTTTYITSQTPITIDCTDVLPHPVDHANVTWRVRFATTCDQLDQAQWGDWSSSEGSTTTFNLPEDSCHQVEYYCRDALGNTEVHQLETDIVDNKAPVITKGIEGPYTGVCPPAPLNGVSSLTASSCIIDGVTNITVDVTDPQPHPVGDISCRWRYNVDGGSFILGGQGLGSSFKVHFPEESNHQLVIECIDGLGNKVTDTEMFQVDRTPPVTTKSFSGPQYPNDGDTPGVTHWITMSTNISLSATDDAGPHISGVNRTYYRVTLLNSSAPCNYDPIIVEDSLVAQVQTSCDLATGSGSWQLYTGAFNVPEDSCHLIEFYSVDNVEKTELENRQCVFVDNQGPLPNKTVGEVKSIINHTLNTNDYVFNFYPQVNGLCFNETNGDAIDCWKVTTMTPITLDCVDQQPHPVDKSKIFFKVDLDGVDVTEQYCNDVEGGDFNVSGDGYCKVGGYDAPAIFKFGEESEHNLKYYCEDELGNTGPVDDEKFKVEGSNFNITINKKWNLISVPFVLLSDSMDDVFGVNPAIDSVWTYDPTLATCGNDWCAFIPDDIDNDDLTSMVPGMGYWVLANDDTTLLIGGSLFSPVMTPPSKTIVAGWNLIGYYGNEDNDGNPVYSYSGPFSYSSPVGNGKTSVCELGTLVDTTIGHPKWASLWTYWEPFNTDIDPSTQLWIPLDYPDRMDAGAGYWIEIDVAESYSPSTTCPLIFP